MRMATHTFTVTIGSEADDVQILLEARERHGVSFTRRRWWLFWDRFEVTAPPGVLESIKVQVDEIETEAWRERQI